MTVRRTPGSLTSAGEGFADRRVDREAERQDVGDIIGESQRHQRHIGQSDRRGGVEFDRADEREGADPPDEIRRHGDGDQGVGRFDRGHDAGADARHDRHRPIDGRARRARGGEREERQAAKRRQLIALVEGLARQDRERDQRHAERERPDAADQSGPAQDRGAEAEARGDAQESEGGDGELRPDAGEARQGDCGPVQKKRGGRIDLDEVAVGGLAVEPLLVGGDQPGDVAEQAVAQLQRDRDESDRQRQPDRGGQAANRGLEAVVFDGGGRGKEHGRRCPSIQAMARRAGRSRVAFTRACSPPRAPAGATRALRRRSRSPRLGRRCRAGGV